MEKKEFILTLTGIIGFILIVIMGILGQSWINSPSLSVEMDNNTRIAVEEINSFAQEINIYQEELKNNITKWEIRYNNLKNSCEEPIINNIDCWDFDNKILFDCEVRESIWYNQGGVPTHTMTYQIKGIEIGQFSEVKK